MFSSQQNIIMKKKKKQILFAVQWTSLVLGGTDKVQKWDNQNDKVTVLFIVTFGTYNSKEPMVYLPKQPLPFRYYFYAF